MLFSVKPQHESAVWLRKLKYLYFYCILLLLFYKDEWKLKKNANNTNEKKCRGQRFKSIETKVELISQPKSCKFLASS